MLLSVARRLRSWPHWSAASLASSPWPACSAPAITLGDRPGRRRPPHLSRGGIDEHDGDAAHRPGRLQLRRHHAAHRHARRGAGARDAPGAPRPGASSLTAIGYLAASPPWSPAAPTLPMLMPGELLAPAFRSLDLAAKNLSRIVEECGGDHGAAGPLEHGRRLHLRHPAACR
ncbi:MAG: hypothetical protein MZV49_13675 [Rhodopseudomonas palustris]|nr:hypothetical protein [Rhodopseudomonas palustris]